MKQISRTRIANPEVAAVFRAYPKTVRPMLMRLRALIIEVATETEGVGLLEESLKWGEPSYLTSQTKSGSTIRIDWKPVAADQIAMFFKCTSNLVATFRRRYPNIFTYGGDRSIIFKLDDEIPENELKRCVSLALTYHLNKKLPTKRRWSLIEELMAK